MKTKRTLLQQRAVVEREEDLEVALAPARPLLVAVAHRVGRLPDRQVLLHVAAVPPTSLELHAEREVLGQRPCRRAADLDERAGADEEVGARAGDEAEGVVPGLHVPVLVVLLVFFLRGVGGEGDEVEALEAEETGR